MQHEVLVSLTRSGLEEVDHYGTVCVWRDGRVEYEKGAGARVIYYRSAAKPFQALAAVESGAVDRFGITDAELALVVGSHSGSPMHAQTAVSILSKAGETPAILRCGGHRPIDRSVAEEYVRRGYPWGRIEDNCSGKHAGMIAAARAWGEETRTYADPGHRVQRHNLANVARFTGLEAGEIRVGVDGCAVPCFGVPVRAMARAAALFGTPESLSEGTCEAVRRVHSVVLAHPEMVAGEGRLDTRIMRATNGRVIAKGGAQGVHTMAVVGERLGVAIKIADGAAVAVHVVAAAVLARLGLLTQAQAEELVPREIQTREGDPVGRIEVKL